MIKIKIHIQIFSSSFSIVIIIEKVKTIIVVIIDDEGNAQTYRDTIA